MLHGKLSNLHNPIFFNSQLSLFWFRICETNICKSVYILSAYDRAAIKFRGVEADINFSLEDYEEDMKQVNRLSYLLFSHQINGFGMFNDTVDTPIHLLISRIIQSMPDSFSPPINDDLNENPDGRCRPIGCSSYFILFFLMIF